MDGRQGGGLKPTAPSHDDVLSLPLRTLYQTTATSVIIMSTDVSTS
jgi:hypothetical protein